MRPGLGWRRCEDLAVRDAPPGGDCRAGRPAECLRRRRSRNRQLPLGSSEKVYGGPDSWFPVLACGYGLGGEAHGVSFHHNLSLNQIEIAAVSNAKLVA